MTKLLLLLATILCMSAIAGDENFVKGSYGRMGVSKKVFGIYLRDQVIDSSTPELRIIGQVGDHCTGTLIGPKHVLTAAHCVFDQESKSWFSDLSFSPGKLKNGHAPFGTKSWSKAFVQKEYINGDGSGHYDFAVVELTEEVGEDLGWSGYRALEASETKANITITGYPGDKPSGTMWTVNCPSEVHGAEILYLCDTYGGMSGSAIYSDVDYQGYGSDFIVAVHTFGSDQANGGVPLTSSNFQLIRSWTQGAEYSANTYVHKKNERNYDRLFIQNNCYKTIYVAAMWKMLDDNWNDNGYWKLAPGERAYIADTRNTIYYVWATTSDRELVWRGNYPVNYNGESLNMIKSQITTTEWGDWTQEFNCN